MCKDKRACVHACTQDDKEFCHAYSALGYVGRALHEVWLAVLYEPICLRGDEVGVAVARANM